MRLVRVLAGALAGLLIVASLLPFGTSDLALGASQTQSVVVTTPAVSTSVALTPTRGVARSASVANTLTPTTSPASTAAPTRTPTPNAATPSRTPTPVPGSQAVASAATSASTATPTTTSPTATSTFVLLIPTRTPTPTFIPTPTRTPTPTSTATPTPRATNTPQTALVAPAAAQSASGTLGAPAGVAAALPGVPLVVPVISNPGVSSITRTGATLTWTTNVPATAEADYGLSPAYGSRAIPDSSLLTQHSLVLTGLQPGTTYHYRLRSVTAPGLSTMSLDAFFTTTLSGYGPDVERIEARQVTATSALIAWSSRTGSVAQLEYGRTANYGQFTLLRSFGQRPQQMLLTGLLPDTTYHVRVKAWDSLGFLGASTDATFTSAVVGQATLVGAPDLQPHPTRLAGGQAAAYQFTAAHSGQTSRAHVFLDAGTAASLMRLAVYDDAGGTPGRILAQGSLSGTRLGWNIVALPPTTLHAMEQYWIALLTPAGTGMLVVRDLGESAVATPAGVPPFGGSSQLSAQTSLAAFPAVWRTGTVSAAAPLAAYLEQVPPVVTLVEPAPGGVLGGQVDLAASVDDDEDVGSVQFFVDRRPIGVPLRTGPYRAVWDASRADASLPHTLEARATDALGREGASATMSFVIDNGPRVSQVLVARGLTASSARVSWITDVPADSQVEYVSETGESLLTPLDDTPDLAHEQQITSLEPGTTYIIRVRSRDANGVLSIGDDVPYTP